MKKGLTYAKSGVNIGRGDAFVDLIAGYCKKTESKAHALRKTVGGFAAVAGVPFGIKEPLFVTSTDGVGTKLLLATELQDFSHIGDDLVAMSVNDVLTTGAKPWLFLDYLATGKIKPKTHQLIIKSIARACSEAGCALVGGETAEMPGMYAPGHVDLAGFCVGVAEKSQLMSSKNVKPGDILIALPSSGFHSNGYSLVRSVIRQAKLSLKKSYAELESKKSLGEQLLAPTRIYVAPVLKALITFGTAITGLAHITGGGIADNLERVIPSRCAAVIDKHLIRTPKLFSFIQRNGNIKDQEMYKTFNMGIGLIVIARPSIAKPLCKSLKGSYPIGHIVKTSTRAEVRLGSKL